MATPAPSCGKDIKMTEEPEETPKRKLQKTNRPRKVSAVAMIVEVRKDFPKPLPPPQVMMEDGWTLFFGDEIGTTTSTTHLHIRNQFVQGNGASIAIELFDCLCQGLQELKPAT